MQRMAGHSAEVLSVLIEKLDKRLDALTVEHKALKERIELRERERLQQERNLAIRGLITLGTIISVLGGIIWNYRSVIFRG